MTVVGLSPYLLYPDPDAAIEWLQDVLGFTDPVRWSDDTGVTAEASIRAGEHQIGIGGRASAAGHGAGAYLIVHVDDADAHHARVNEAVVQEVPPPIAQPYGPRTFEVTDPWGYTWSLWQGEALPPA